MIPKIIHACWLGNKQMPKEQQNYIEGWRKLHPDFEIKIWTDAEFNKFLDDSLFVKDCIKLKKYGFLSDYFRFIILYKFGGIYIDTDVEIFKSLHEFLQYDLFLGFIVDSSIGTALIGSKKNNPLMLKFLQILIEDYKNKKEFTVSNDWVTKYFIENFNDFKLNGKRQSLQNGIEIFPKDYFERYKINKNSGGGYAEHHCYGSWKDNNTSPFYIKIAKRVLPRRVVSYFGHKAQLKRTPYYKIYLKDKNK